MADRRAQDRRVVIPGDPIAKRVDGGFPGRGKASGGLCGQDGVTEGRSRCFCISVAFVGSDAEGTVTANVWSDSGQTSNYPTARRTAAQSALEAGSAAAPRETACGNGRPEPRREVGERARVAVVERGLVQPSAVFTVSRRNQQSEKVTRGIPCDHRL